MYIIVGILLLLFLGLIMKIFEHFTEYWYVYLGILVSLIIIGFLGSKGFFIILICTIFFVIVKLMVSVSQRKHEKRIELEIEKQRTLGIMLQKDSEARKHSNDIKLKEELEQNCKYLGTMNATRWKNQLANYSKKDYETSFEKITQDFAWQMEKQYIDCMAEKWMKDFEEYIVKKPAGSPIEKMLAEVDCDALRVTHITPTKEILEKYMDEWAREKGEDIPAKFKIVEAGEYKLYQPTPYLEHIYKKNKTGGCKKEIIVDDDEEWADIP